jgi:AcrR family transcriptional regulator
MSSPGAGTDDGPVKARRGSTRERILQTSLELFAARGFDGTDIVEIEEAVGLTPGSGGFYRHFKNKENVLHAVVEAEVERVQAYQERQKAARRNVTLTADIDPATVVGDGVDRMLDTLWELRHLMAVIGHDSERFPDLLPRISSAMGDGRIAIDAEELDQLMDAGTIPRRPAQVVASIMLMAGVGYTRTAQLFDGPVAAIDRSDFRAVLIDMVLGR